jgi:hypothetical protein
MVIYKLQAVRFRIINSKPMTFPFLDRVRRRTLVRNEFKFNAAVDLPCVV